ncbi:hypothetical protein C8R43DRAFT_1038547 [Mycena crocata]|nr:hypothetical protein C8R43DRAFT_1038547 [Mycena crocata]
MPPQAMELEEDQDVIAQATQLVKTVYQEVYEDFRSWKLDYASKILHSLGHPPSRAAEPVSGTPSVTEPEPAPNDPVFIPFESSTSAEYIEVYDYETGTTERVPMQMTHWRVQDVFPASPAYEYCTPTPRNILHGDDPRELPFIPFPDDPTFDHRLYLEEYDEFAWEQPVLDPDLEAVVIETARRLQKDHNMRYEHIDETEVLPLPLLDVNGRRGMISRSHRRDFLPWPPGVPHSEKPLRNDAPSADESPEKILSTIVSNFCPNLNCLMPFCSTHLDPTPLSLPKQALVKSHRLRDRATSPCGDDCFIHKSVADEPLNWNTHDTRLLRKLLEHSPDALPCDLAIICCRPCFEVFPHRQTMLPDETIGRTRTKGKGKAAFSKPKLTKAASSLTFDDFDTKRFTPDKPCRHEGECNAVSGCACFKNKAHCERNCRCSRKCTRRWRGCACAISRRGGATCRTDRCACYLAHRECDPEICIKCRAKDSEANICYNADIQRGNWKRTKVARATYGMGLFIAEAANVDDLIIEYAGELIYDATTDSREPLAEHRKRNYLFELNSTLSIDGLYAGNDARYINHDAVNPNCRAKVCMVNGEHRIGMYATRTLNPGEEILFNYGDQFFLKEAEGGPESASARGWSARRST